MESAMEHNVKERPQTQNKVRLTKNPTSVSPEMPMLTLILFGYIAMGVIQLVAIATGLVQTWQWNWLLAIPVTLLVVAIPILGAAMGTWAAAAVWNWHWFGAFCLFFWPIVLMGILYLIRAIKTPYTYPANEAHQES